MAWVHEGHVYETVDWFIREALPDSVPSREDLPFQIEEMGRTDDHGRWWTVSVDIPTSVKGMDCWLSFRVVEPGSGPRDAYVDDINAVRSGRDENQYDTYVWDDSEHMWITAPNDD